jgi:hypothetical protein
MIDTVDSSRDRAGKQYRAGLIRPVNADNGVIIRQGSVATLTLARNVSGWGVQLSSVVINGQVVPVTSNSGSVVGAAAQKDTANAATAASAVLGQFGRKPTTFPAFAALATGERVMLTPGVTLSFVLSAIPPLNPATPAAGSTPSASAAYTVPAATAAQPPAAAAGQSAPAQTQKQQGEGWWWYCSATNTAGRQYMTGVFFYPADIRGSYGTEAINTAWGNYIQSKHPMEPNMSPGCQLGGADQASTQRLHDHMRASYRGGQVVDVDWKYMPGQDTPPVRIGYYYCFAYFGQSSKSNYASSVFAAPMGLDTDIMAKDFAQFVKEKYQSGESGEKVTRTCYGAAIDKAVAEAGKPNMEARWRSGKFIETGWEPKTLPPARDTGRH